MKHLFGLLVGVLLAMIFTSCEKYESLDAEYSHIYGTWKLVDYSSGGTFRFVSSGIDHITIVRSNEKKVDDKRSKFADYQSYLNGNLVAEGEVNLTNQTENTVQINFTNHACNGCGALFLLSVDETEMSFKNIQVPITYSFVRVTLP